MTRFRQTIAETLNPRLFAWGAFLIPVFAFAAPNISYWPLVLGGIAGLARFAAMRSMLPRPMRPLIFWMLPMLLWIGITSIYALDTLAGFVQFLKLAGYGVCGLLLIWIALDHGGTMRRACGLAHLTGTAALTVVMTVDLVTSGAVSALLPDAGAQVGIINLNGAATTYLALLVWPLFVWLRESGRTWTAFLLPMPVIVFAWFFGHYAILVALLAGAVIFGMTLARPRATGIIVASLSVGFVLLAPATGRLLAPGSWLRSVPPIIRFSAYHRTKIWEFSAARIAERPIFGWGIGASRRIPGGNTIVDINRDLGYPGRRIVSTAAIMPLHPHNAALQVWLELGLIGAILLAVLCGGVPLACLRAAWSRASMAAGLAIFSTAYIIAMLSYSLWQSRWNALLWLVAANAILLLYKPSGKAKAD